MKFARGFARSILPNLVAGLTSGLVTLVYSVSFAALVFSERLSSHLPQGLGTALIGAAITATLVAWRSPFPFTLAGPEANSAIVLALLGRSIADALDAPGQEAFVYPTVWAGIILSTVLTGLVLYLLGRFRLGQLARYVPFPVIGGFLAGTGWLIMRSSFKVMTGIPLGFAELPLLVRPDVASQWIVGLGVAVTLFVVLSRFKHFLVLPCLLLAGVALGNLVRWSVSSAGGEKPLAEWFFQPFAQEGVWQAWSLSTPSYVDWSVLYQQSGTLLAMMAIVILSILLNSTGLELATGRNVDLNDELRANGVANLVNGACGGMIGYISINRCLLNKSAGATSPVAGIIAGSVCGAVLLFGSSFLAHVPKPLLGGLLLFLGSNLFIRWVFTARRQLPRFDYLLVITILVVIVTVGFIAGIAAGILIACMLFIVTYGKTSSIKYSLSGKTYDSNVSRSGAQQQLLDREGDLMTILVLHGFVFFGTANDLLDGIRRRLLAPGTRKLKYAVFDFRLVTGLDSSAVLSFLKLGQLAEKNGLSLVFTSLSPTIAEQLRQGGGFAAAGQSFRLFEDLDHGVEWCENQILQEHGLLETESIPLEEQLELLLKNREQVVELMPFLKRIEVARGQEIFRQGAPSDGLYLLEKGRVSVFVQLPSGIRLRRRTYTGGTILGELGLYSGAARSASVMADEASVLHYLSIEAFREMEQRAPHLASWFNKGIVNLVAERLRRSEEEVKILLQ